MLWLRGVFPFILNTSQLCVFGLFFFFCPSDTWNDLSMAGAQFGPDAFCLLGGGKKHPPAGIGMVGERAASAEGREVVGTRGPQQVPEMGPVCGAGADLQWVAPTIRVARVRG